MRIGQSVEEISAIDNEKRCWGPTGYPDFPLPDEHGRIHKEEVFGFMKFIREDMKEWVGKKEYDLVKRVWAVKMEGNEKVSGMLIGVGVEKSNTPGFPHTPLVWMIPLERDVSIETWGKGMTEEQRIEQMKGLELKGIFSW